MAGKSHELTARVVLQGKVDNTFTEIGTQLQNLGDQLLRTNRWVINFGKESLDSYVSFEDAMLDAYAAMRKNYKDQGALERDYQSMWQNAEKYAAATRFTTLELGTAYSIAAHAGKDFADADYLVQTAMDLALAGGMELGDAMNSLIVIMNSAGLSMEDANDVVNQLVYGGNSAATTVEELTSAMVRTGPSLKFFNGDMAAATAIMGILADNGMTAEQAGTLLRGTMLRLVAPTDKASEAMESLGATEEEAAEAIEEAGAISDETMALLEKAGFSVYDENGNLKDMISIWWDLGEAIANLPDEATRNKVMREIFPSRQFNAASAILENYESLIERYGNIVSAPADYAKETGRIMESGFGGTMRRIDAKIDTFKTKLGGVIADDLAAPAEMAAGALDWVLNIDEGKLGAVTGFFETIIGGAGMLTVAGAGMKIIGTAIGAIPGGKLVLAAVGIAGITTAALRLYDAAQEDKLGDMTLSMSSFTETFTNLAGAYDGKYVDVQKYNEQISTLIGNYQTASTIFSQGLWDMFINGSGMSEDDWKESQASAISAVESMDEAAKGVIDAEYNMVSGVVAAKAANDDTGLWAQVQEHIDAGYETMLADVNAKGIAVRKALLSGWEDGVLTDEEVALIYSTLRDYDQTLANYAEYKNQGKLLATLHNAQNVSADTVGEFYDTIAGARDASIDLGEDEFWTELGMAKVGGASQEELDAMLADHDAEVLAKKALYGQQMLDVFKLAMMSNYGYTDFGKFIDEQGVDAQEFVKDFVSAVGPEVLKYMALTDADSALVYNQWADYFGLTTRKVGRKGHVYMPDVRDKVQMPGEDEAPQSWVQKMLGGWSDAVGWIENIPGEIKDNFSVELPVKADHSEFDNWKYTVEMQGLRIPVYMIPQGGGGGGGQDPTNLLRDSYAEGGRADVASIFGEAGPEWAIPEEHSSRTAELLRMAAAASGFTWGELLSARGGLNAGSGGASTVVYSPTIYANDAKGLRDELIADKSRLEKWWREHEMMSELTSYA